MKVDKKDKEILELRIKNLQLEVELELFKERHRLEERFWRVIERLLPIPLPPPEPNTPDASE